MNKLVGFIFLFFSLSSTTYAADLSVDNLRLYASNYNKMTGAENLYAWVLKNDSCVTVKVKSGKTKRFCEIIEGIKLDDSPSDPNIYVYNLEVIDNKVKFSVTAYWNSQNCTITPENGQLICHHFQYEYIEPEVDPNELDKDEDEDLDFSDL